MTERVRVDVRLSSVMQYCDKLLYLNKMYMAAWIAELTTDNLQHFSKYLNEIDIHKQTINSRHMLNNMLAIPGNRPRTAVKSRNRLNDKH